MTGGEGLEGAGKAFEQCFILLGTDFRLDDGIDHIPRGKSVVVVIGVKFKECFRGLGIADGHGAIALTSPNELHNDGNNVGCYSNDAKEEREPE